ncbi:MAG: hypothetical protein HZA17_08710 [Nitrospirae bacterium]|nr:hypothetical protein [Nitrospirota bacterium]
MQNLFDMNRVIVLVLLFSFSVIAASYAEGDKVTPYGDYCRDCAIYGNCPEIIPPSEAVRAIDRYYRQRGYRVEVVNHKGRFIEAEIYKHGRQVDKVIFDRKTGRLRSIY